MRSITSVFGLILVCPFLIFGQQPAADAPTITTKEFPPAGLWNYYSVLLEASGGTEPYKWHLVNGTSPRGLEIHDFGSISGTVDQQGVFGFALEAIGHDDIRSKPKTFEIRVEPPLTADWSKKSHVTGNRIEGSVKVSNTTGRDFDLTFVVLAVNDIGRATAIGYQHFPLKRNTRDMELPFGDTLSRGNYVVHIDVVGEEPLSKMIFRTRLVAPDQAITQGP